MQQVPRLSADDPSAKEGNTVQIWDIRSSDSGRQTGPQVLFSTPEARSVLVDLATGKVLGDHRVRERTVLQIVSGLIEITAGGETAMCAEGVVVLLEPGEVHSVRAQEDSRLLLVLAPWPGTGHYDPAELSDPHLLPVNATSPEKL